MPGTRHHCHHLDHRAWDRYWQFFRDADAVLQEFEPRAHWGKIHFMTRSRLERLYPELDTFIQVRREFDPRGIFLNDHTRALVG
ncbi:D-arabinono-1,4-lactone oxidase [Arthrobacter sp. K5]|uniref:D-arabinono-1,4-lactone oxidase n=1 Tax=Arthrobacter sp. K5 TaxID=2839623 RepID=A0AAU8EV93_9MICC